ncbi:Z-ring formation inhibitor MciZ [Paenibacillus sacheonensis]|uniref:Z-ring formation inhibitor MciZ n=1 Tax=Paenibacillus sacheonensis TaxID=742054 RepID=A0A7X4YP34_9BACL|nr:Z-ring formation inhibitor MciZ [Paenibacillus sacheonensis]MBM7564407.1 hypothetical protein [Paenibacillus sacheonensis]NBC68969.1 Z-ring formation inhibitor MciZ [Paenibacillus sacheonensis]
MKQYIDNGQLILVGKAWEIRHQLKLLGKPALKSGTAHSAQTLREYTRQAVSH